MAARGDESGSFCLGYDFPSAQVCSTGNQVKQEITFIKGFFFLILKMYGVGIMPWFHVLKIPEFTMKEFVLWNQIALNYLSDLGDHDS